MWLKLMMLAEFSKSYKFEAVSHKCGQLTFDVFLILMHVNHLRSILF